MKILKASWLITSNDKGTIIKDGALIFDKKIIDVGTISYIEEKYPNIKIQLVSGFTDEKHLNTADKSLHEKLLHKPYSPQDLFEGIRALLDGK